PSGGRPPRVPRGARDGAAHSDQPVRWLDGWPLPPHTWERGSGSDPRFHREVSRIDGSNEQKRQPGHSTDLCSRFSVHLADAMHGAWAATRLTVTLGRATYDVYGTG